MPSPWKTSPAPRRSFLTSSTNDRSAIARPETAPCGATADVNLKRRPGPGEAVVPSRGEAVARRADASQARRARTVHVVQAALPLRLVALAAFGDAARRLARWRLRPRRPLLLFLGGRTRRRC